MKGRSFLMPIAVGASLVWGGIGAAQDGGDISAAVHSGGCDDLGQEVASLTVPSSEDGEWAGVDGIGAVLESETDDVASGQALLDSPHSIVVFAQGNVVACGEVGGNVDDEDLDIGLRPVGDSGYFGIAKLNDVRGDDDTDGADDADDPGDDDADDSGSDDNDEDDTGDPGAGGDVDIDLYIFQPVS